MKRTEQDLGATDINSLDAFPDVHMFDCGDVLRFFNLREGEKTWGFLWRKIKRMSFR